MEIKSIQSVNTIIAISMPSNCQGLQSVHLHESSSSASVPVIIHRKRASISSGKHPKNKTVFWGGYLFQIWVGGVADSQTRSIPPKITLKIYFFVPNFTFGVPKSHKNPGVGSQIWENFPKKLLFLGGFPHLKK